MEVEFENIIKNLPEEIYNILKTTPENIKKNAREIKLRIGKKININHNNETLYLNKILTIDEIEEIFKAICNYSVHSHTEEIKKGFITLKGGHRAGICGTAVYENNKLVTIKNISSINLRIARQVFGVASPIITKFKETLKNF